MTFRPPKDAKEGCDHYEAAIRMAQHIKIDEGGGPPGEGDPVLKSEVAALHALTMVDPDGMDIGPDYELVERVANLARRGYDLIDGEIVRVRKTRLDDGKDRRNVRIGERKPKRAGGRKAKPSKGNTKGD